MSVVTRGQSHTRGKTPSNLSVGKRQEFVVIAELLRHGYDVYSTLVDERGIDYVVRYVNEDSRPVYLDVQIKGLSAQDKQPRHFKLGKVREHDRGNLFFILYCEKDEVYWIIPAADLEQIGGKYKMLKKEEDGYFFNAPPADSKRTKRSSFFESYMNRFDLLAQYDPENDFDPIEETSEILADKELMSRIKKSVKQARKGKTVAWETVKKRAFR
jgi:hypothetical protein